MIAGVPARQTAPGRAAEPPPDPPTPVPRLLWLAAQHLTGLLHERLRDAGFDDQRPSDDAAFAHIPPGGIRLTDLARRAGVTKQAMAEVVDSLEARRYVERRPDPSDGRAKLIDFSARGWVAVATAVDAMDDIERQVSERLGERRVDALRRALELIIDGPTDR